MIELPWPSKPLWPNFRSRTHWAKTRATKAARGEAFYATKAAKVGIAAGDVPITVQATFYPPDRRDRDYDNCGASLKAYWDGIADALGVNDSAFRHSPPIIADVVKGGKVVVTIGRSCSISAAQARGELRIAGDNPAVHLVISETSGA